MSGGLTFARPFLGQARLQLLADPRETCAVFFTHESRAGRWVVRDGEVAPESAYQRRSETAAELSPAYLVDVTSRARRSGMGLVLAHTHPLSTASPVFSRLDDIGEVALARFLNGRIPELQHLALVVSPGGLRARLLGVGPEVPVWAVGADIERLSGGSAVPPAAPVYDRQVRAFGEAGQHVLQGLRVGIVGLGGTGSVVAQELALLGVRDFILIDPDTLETTNRNRVFGAEAPDVGQPKVRLAARTIQRINPEATTDCVQADVLTAPACEHLVQADIIFLCTDSHASRALVAQVAYQHLIPTFDMGVSIGVTADRGVRDITGRVQMLAPGLPCLLCAGALDPDAIRRELMSEAQRQADPYFRGVGAPQPAVASLNATVSSLAVSMFLASATGVPMKARYQWYDGVSGVVRSLTARPSEICMVCSPSGVLARGASARLPFKACAA